MICRSIQWQQSVSYAASGRHRFESKDTSRKPQTKSFTLKSDALAWARQVEAEIQSGVFVDTVVAERMAVRDAIELR